MNNKKSPFIEALDKCEDRRDGGFKQTWRCSLSDDSEDDSRHDAALVTMERVSGQQELSSEGIKTPSSTKRFSANGSVETHDRRPYQLKPLNRTGKISDAAHSVSMSPLPNRTSFLIMSPAPQAVVVQGRVFQHAQLSTPIRKLEHRSDLIQRGQMDSIVLTCPEISDPGDLSIKRRVHQKRRIGESPVPVSQAVEQPLQPDDYLTVCGECGQPSEDHVKCDHCGFILPDETKPRPAIASVLPPRPSIRPQPASLQMSKGFYECSQQLDVIVNPSVRITPGNLLFPHNGRPSGSLACNGHKAAGGAKQQLSKPCELNDPIVLSSDEDDESDNVSSTGTANRLDSVSPRPADSAHSSPAPSDGRLEAVVKAAGEHEDPSADFFTHTNHRNLLPRRNRMKDPFGNLVSDDATVSKRRKINQEQKLSSIILECRSVRIGTLRRMVTKPVVFTVDFIQLETEGREVDVLESVSLKASELTRCEWCNVKKLPVLFLQTSDQECQRLQTQLQMSQDSGGIWYDCNGNNDEKYIVLIFEHGPSMHEQVILEDILTEIGRNNRLADFPSKISFDEANVRLVNYNKASLEKEKVKVEKAEVLEAPSSSALLATPSLSVVTVAVAPVNTSPAVPVPCAAPSVQARMSARLQEFCDDDDEMAELQPTFTGPIIKLLVYPPPPAKGGISVTNEDLHCLSDGEFLNDVIIDFYLKYLFLEKLKKEDAVRSHVFSSFFYKRLNQRERRNTVDTSSLPIQKRKHNRVKTWTRHVDLFQKDFIFVPINESAHWYLAVICFPGLESAQVEPNPLYQPQTAVSSSLPTDGASEERDQFSQNTAVPHRAEANQVQLTDGLRRIIEYNTEDDSHQSDDQSSCPDECSEDGALADESGSFDRAEWTSKPTICKQPCILIMDSLRGPTRSTVVKTLREYLEVEWEVKKGSRRSFGKELMKGSSPRVPQQDNFSDCGVYVLQYVESFFESPLPSFHLPMNLLEWFPQQRMKTKREEIKDLILKLQTQQQLSLESSDQTDRAHSPYEDSLESADLIPPISS
ncbi:sentrin-specific protease 6 isoform X1 [Danio aesculapii]|uniref:sentrin-specific protease 6 isoform X1 n=2 Tax=Danio aesculapii TaxID=1142201 RepID=UPI0024C0CB81|nr:sentrin-specific protease 6 isoform X1 [Danio aesculapii]XP_056337175.1 sentrin-specific protease 6 isoform X1 [Danio aesculapii]